MKYLWLEPDRHMVAYLGAHPDAVKSGDKAYKALVEKALLKLRKKMGPYWQRTQDGVKSVLDYAAEKKVRLGLENRERFEELPVDADFPGAQGAHVVTRDDLTVTDEYHLIASDLDLTEQVRV